MNNENIQHHYDAFARIQAFGLKYADRFPEPGKASALFAEMAVVVPRLEQLGVGKFAGETEYHSGTSAKRRAAEQVIEDMRTLRDTAKAIASADKNPDFVSPFYLPRSKAFAILVTRATAVLHAGRAHEARFREYELPVGFLDAFAVKLDQLEAADDQQEAGFSARVGETAAIVAAVDRGIELRRELMPLIRNKFKDEPGITAEWETASRIVRRQRSQEEPETAA